MRMNVPQLLTALVGLGTVTLGIVAWDAERLIGAVDDLREAQAADHLQVQVAQGHIDSLIPRVGVLEGVAQDHERRIIRMEPRP